MTTWRKCIARSMESHNETFADVVLCTLSGSELDVEFDDGYGSAEGKPFTLWTANRVYFPSVYDGAEDCESVPRNPCNEAVGHVGGQ